MRIFISSLILVLLSISVQAQKTSRSGFPAEPEIKDRFRRFPCGGNVIMEEDFSNGLPTGWQVLDVDQLEPRAEITDLTPDPGWQSVIDFKDNLKQNKVFASPSWYKDTVATSDDYLILPQMVLPNNTCLSWFAYSQDVEFEESYEIRVSTTTPDAAGFLANPAVYVVENQGSSFTFESASLADYGGQNVYIAFRHTSRDKFILAIDDVRLAEVENRDIAMFEVDPITANPGDSIFIRGSVINRGLVSVVFDSLQMQVRAAVSGVEIFNFAVADSFELLPNDTIQFISPTAWVPAAEASVALKVWVSGFGTDDQVENDTLSRFQPIGNTVGIFPELQVGRLSIHPNPVQDLLSLDVEEFKGMDLRMTVLDLKGSVVLREERLAPVMQNSWLIPTKDLNAGIYFLRIQDAEGRMFMEKFVKE